MIWKETHQEESLQGSSPRSQVCWENYISLQLGRFLSVCPAFALLWKHILLFNCVILWYDWPYEFPWRLPKSCSLTLPLAFSLTFFLSLLSHTHTHTLSLSLSFWPDDCTICHNIILSADRLRAALSLLFEGDFASSCTEAYFSIPSWWQKYLHKDLSS